MVDAKVLPSRGLQLGAGAETALEEKIESKFNIHKTTMMAKISISG